MRGTAGELGGRLVPGQVRRTIGTEDWVGTRSGERTENEETNGRAKSVHKMKSLRVGWRAPVTR